MDNSDIGKIILVVIMMAFSALFSSTETAFSSVNKLRLKNYASQGNKKAARALKLANKFDDVLTAVYFLLFQLIDKQYAYRSFGQPSGNCCSRSSPA